MSVIFELLEKPKLEPIQCKEQIALDNSNNIVKIQSLFRTYHACKSFCLIKAKHSVPLTEVFTNFSIFKSQFMAYIDDTVIDHLEKCGMYFNHEAISEKSWNGPITTDFTHFYYGETDEQNAPHGFGVLISFASVYEGAFSNGELHNKGRMIGSEDGVYDGDWQAGQKNGNGTMIYWNGSKYSGNWKDGQKHGQGVLDEQESHYEGNFKNDLRHGYGELTFQKQKFSYKGSFVNGEFEGFGLLIDEDEGHNEIYEGEFKSSLYHGKGTWTRDGWTYIGDFVKGKRSGFGSFQNSTWKYENEWRMGKPYGNYNLYSTRKYVLKGTWCNDGPRNHMDEILIDLFLGSYLAATNENWLREVGIRHIVRVLNDENVELLSGFTYFFVKAKDKKTQNIIEYLPEVIEFITKLLIEHKKVLVLGFLEVPQ